MLETKHVAQADAVWNSRGGMAEASAKAKSAALTTTKAKTAKTASRKPAPTATTAHKKTAKRGNARVPDFVEPQLCKSAERPPSAGEWAHEVKFDGYRMQLRIAGGKATLKTRKGLDWSEKFPAITALAENFPDALIDGEVAALDDNGSPDFAALQAALSDGDTDELVFFAFDLLFVNGEDLRPLTLRERK
jgi:bifunctional non-homologous end joining protein LigD